MCLLHAHFKRQRTHKLFQIGPINNLHNYHAMRIVAVALEDKWQVRRVGALVLLMLCRKKLFVHISKRRFTHNQFANEAIGKCLIVQGLLYLGGRIGAALCRRISIGLCVCIGATRCVGIYAVFFVRIRKALLARLISAVLARILGGLFSTALRCVLIRLA